MADLLSDLQQKHDVNAVYRFDQLFDPNPW